VAFALPGGVGRIDPGGRSDAEGRVSVRVHEIGRTDQGQNPIVATVDWQAFMSDLDAAARQQWAPRLKGVSATFAYKIRTAATTRVAVRIAEYVDDKAQRQELLTSGLSQSLLKQKFDVTDAKVLGGLDGTKLTTATPGELQSLVGEGADVVVVGEVRSEFSSQAGPGIVFYRARASVRAVNVKTGQVLAVLTGEQKGAGNTNDRAGKTALQKVVQSGLADEMAGEISRGLR
jgi:hypothetical protein